VSEPEVRGGRVRHLRVAWTGSKPPKLFGRRFDHVPSPNHYGLPAFYALHAWI
jgi:hypothetical protein